MADVNGLANVKIAKETHEKLDKIQQYPHPLKKLYYGGIVEKLIDIHESKLKADPYANYDLLGFPRPSQQNI